MYMSDIFCVTNRKLCREDFLVRIERIAACHPAGIILREKDMKPEDYKELASAVMGICEQHGVKCILHSFTDVATFLHADALEAQALGCTYITAGHVFETDCKKGLPGRGLEFLRSVCAAVDIPVYGIGGIDADNIALVRNAGANGACLMSSMMVTEDVAGLLKAMEG